MIDHDSLTLFESRPICLYLAREFAPINFGADTVRQKGLAPTVGLADIKPEKRIAVALPT